MTLFIVKLRLMFNQRCLIKKRNYANKVENCHKKISTRFTSFFPSLLHDQSVKIKNYQCMSHILLSMRKFHVNKWNENCYEICAKLQLYRWSKQ